MSEQMTNSDTDESMTDEERRFARGAILRRLSDSRALTELQKDLLVAAIRNPDAPLSEVADHVEGGNTGSLRNVLTRYELGGFDGESDYNPRLQQGPADFRELTVKQRAVVDFMARHPKAIDDVTGKKCAKLIADELGVSISPVTVAAYRRDFPGQISRRRDWYEDRDPDMIERLDAEAKGEGTGKRVPVRDDLLDAGFDELPERNLDGLIVAEEAEERRRKRAGETMAEVHAERRNGERGQTSVGDVDNATNAEPSGETVERDVGGRSYRGPAEGVDLAGGGEVSVFELASAKSEGDELAEGYREAIEAAGPYGEEAYRRDVDIDDRDDLENEIRRLRMIISAQGSLVRTLKETLESLDVDVRVTVRQPDEADDEA